jgi:hypothetical protein
MRKVESVEILNEFRNSIGDFVRGRENLATARLRFLDAIMKYRGVLPKCIGEGVDWDKSFNSAANHYHAMYCGARNYYGWRD